MVNSTIAAKRDKLQQLLLEKILNLVVNGDADRLVPGIPNSAIIARIRHRLAISTGSACSSGVESPSQAEMVRSPPLKML